MKRMEDIIKDRLEEYEETLPETGLAEFLTRLDESRSKAVPVPTRKPHRSIWGIVTPAVAASLLAVFVLTRPQNTHETLAEQEPVAIVEESVPVNLLAQADIAEQGSGGSRSSAAATVVKKQTDVIETTDNDFIVDSIIDESAPEDASSNDSSNSSDASGDTDYSNIEKSKSNNGHDDFDAVKLSLGSDYSDNQIYINVVKGAAGTIGTVSLVSALSSIGGFFTHDYSDDFGNTGLPSDDPVNPAEPPYQYPDYVPGYSGLDNTWPDRIKNLMPLTVGTSIRWNFADRLSLTSGLEYNRYKSFYKYNRWTSEVIQKSIGIPVRIDYSYVRSKLVDLYLGAGGSAEYIFSTSVNGGKRDTYGLSFSAQAATGLQLNFNKHLGTYIEPQLIWLVPSVFYDDDPSRRDYPLFIKVATGIRYTF